MHHTRGALLITLAFSLLVAPLAALSRLPTMHNIRPFVEAGGLMAYGPSPHDIRRRAASYTPHEHR